MDFGAVRVKSVSAIHGNSMSELEVDVVMDGQTTETVAAQDAAPQDTSPPNITLQNATPEGHTTTTEPTTDTKPSPDPVVEESSEVSFCDYCMAKRHLIVVVLAAVFILLMTLKFVSYEGCSDGQGMGDGPGPKTGSLGEHSVSIDSEDFPPIDEDYDEYDYNGIQGLNGWYDVEYLGSVDYFCGNVISENLNISAAECVSNCYLSPNGGSVAFYIASTYACICEPFISTHHRRQSQYPINVTELQNCESTNMTVHEFEASPRAVDGRPYIIDFNEHDLKADVSRIECDDFSFYGKSDTEWMDFVTNHRVNVSMEVVNSWIDKAFSEHASIATFAKFSVELMSLGAPLWFLERSNVAALQEIEHAQISFDVLNMYLMHNYADNGCIVYNSFPSHTMNIDGDYNRIALDTAIGGCFGETLSAMTYQHQLNVDLKGESDDSTVGQKLNGIANDEVEHAALAWTTVKWIIDEFEDTDIGDRQWWTQEMRKREIVSSDMVERTVYERVIPMILDKLFNSEETNVDYKGFYVEIKETLMHFVQTNAAGANVEMSDIVCINNRE